MSTEQRLSVPRSPKSPPLSRQRPGTACEECRRRKLRCDRKRPKCSLCEEGDKKCVVTPTGPRGPKRGHMKALQARVAALEGCINQQKQSQDQTSTSNEDSFPQQQATQNDLGSNTEAQSWSDPVFQELGVGGTAGGFNFDTPLFSLDSTIVPDHPADNASSDKPTDAADAHVAPSSLIPDKDEVGPLGPLTASDPAPWVRDEGTMKARAKSIGDASCATRTHLIEAERDQLYFDRLHEFCPIVHEYRYRSWSRRHDKSPSQTCLQQAMWALSACVSAHSQDTATDHYGQARQALAGLEIQCNATEIPVEQVQAWMLLAIYEFMRVDFQKGWLSAGRAFRLVQLMRLYELDSTPSVHLDFDFTDTESKRRTFWMAYLLDRFISISNGYQLTLNELVISVRLPASDADFQACRPAITGFLSETIGAQGSTIHDPFTECIVLATISGRALSHRHQSLVERLYMTNSHDFWYRHNWIHDTLTQYLGTLAFNYPSPSTSTDPMLLFTCMMAQTTVLYLYKLLECVKPESGQDDAVVAKYMQASSAAAQEVVNLTDTLSRISMLKIHPLMPIPLSLCAEFLQSKCEAVDSGNEQLQRIRAALEEIQPFNHLGASFSSLHPLETSSTTTTTSDSGLFDFDVDFTVPGAVV